MGSANETCTDTEFIQLWGQLQSATRVAEHLGISVRATHLRRRWIENQYNMALPAIDYRGVKYDKNNRITIAAASKVGKESFGYGYRDTAAHLAKPSTKQVKANKSKLTNAHVRFVVIRAASSKHLHLSQVVVLDESGSNVARGKPCTSSSYWGNDISGNANNAVDGVMGLKRHPHEFHSAAFGDWWMVDLERVHTVVSVTVYNRGDCCQDRLAGAHMLLLNSDKFVIADRFLDGSPIQTFAFSRATDKNHLRAGVISIGSSLLTPEQQNTTLAPGYFWIEPIFGQWYCYLLCYVSWQQAHSQF